MDNTILGGIILRGLGERLNGIQEVSGSIPAVSTKKHRISIRNAVLFYFLVCFQFVIPCRSEIARISAQRRICFTLWKKLFNRERIGG